MMNLICSQTGKTVHRYNGPKEYPYGHKLKGVVAECRKLVKTAIVVSRREALEDDYVICRCAEGVM